jgi:hypothetical protein
MAVETLHAFNASKQSVTEGSKWPTTGIATLSNWT